MAFPIFQGQRRHPEGERGGRAGRDPQPGSGGLEGGRLAGAPLHPPQETSVRESARAQIGERTQRSRPCRFHFCVCVVVACGDCMP